MYSVRNESQIAVKSPNRTNDFLQLSTDDNRASHSSRLRAGLGRGLAGRGRGFDMGSITIPDRALQRQKAQEAAGSSPVAPARIP